MNSSPLDEQRLLTMRQRGMDDLFYFGKVICGFKDMVEPLHRDLCDFMTQPDPQAGDKRRSLVLVAREHLKSTICTTAYPLWRLAHNPNERILIGSYSHARAKKFLSGIKSIIEVPDDQWVVNFHPHPKFFRTLFGDWSKGQSERFTWNDQAIRVWNWRTDTITPFISNMESIQTLGIGQQIASMHPSIAIFDDLVDEKSAKFEKDRQSAISFCQYVEPLVPAGGEVWWIGTYYDINDVYCHLKKEVGDLYNLFVWPMQGPPEIKPETKKVFVPKNYPAERFAWPERFNEERARNMHKAMGNAFYTQYMLDPWAEKNSSFQKEWLRFFNINQIFDGKRYKRNLHVTMSVDPNVGGEIHRDYAGIVVNGTDCMGRWYCLEAEGGPWDIPETVERIFTTYRRWPDIRAVGVEAHSWEKFFSLFIYQTARLKGIQLPWVSLKLNTRKSKDERLLALFEKFRSFELYLQEEQKELIEEITRYRPKGRFRDDVFDAYAYQLFPGMARPAFKDDAGQVSIDQSAPLPIPRMDPHSVEAAMAKDFRRVTRERPRFLVDCFPN